MKQTFFKLGLLCATTISLAACGVTTGSGTTGNSNVTSLATSHAAKKTFTGLSNAILYSQASGVSLGSDKQSFSIVANSSGGYDGVLNGKKFSFTASEWDAASFSYKKQLSTNEIVMFSIGHKMGNNNYKYADIVAGGYVNSATKIASVGYAAYGEKTISMPSTGVTASYSGNAAAIIVNRGGDNLSNAVAGSITLNANFSTGKLGGQITNMSNLNGAMVGQLNIENAAITHNGFEAILKGNNTLNASYGEVISGRMQGKFFGPNADETAGKFTISSPSYIGAGVFIAKQ